MKLFVAALVLVVSMPAPASGGFPGGDDEADQAATYAIRNIAQAGLLDPLGQYYGYSGILDLEDRWVISFQSNTCYDSEELYHCDPNTGSRDDPQDDAWLEIRVEGNEFVVSDAFGRFTVEQEADLRAYREPTTIEPTHLEFPTVRIDPGWEQGLYNMRGSNLWAGHLPAVGTWSVCRPTAYDSEGNVIYEGVLFADGARRNEYFRSNGHFLIEVPDLPTEPASAAMPCELWSGETWVQRGEATLKTSDEKPRLVEVLVPLEWPHEKVLALFSSCEVSLQRRDGRELASKIVRGPNSPSLSGRKATEHVAFSIDRPQRAHAATIRCLPRGSTFD